MTPRGTAPAATRKYAERPGDVFRSIIFVHTRVIADPTGDDRDLSFAIILTLCVGYTVRMARARSQPCFPVVFVPCVAILTV